VIIVVIWTEGRGLPIAGLLWCRRGLRAVDDSGRCPMAASCSVLQPTMQP